MNETLILVGLGCIIAAVVGGGLKLAGLELPLLASIQRQVLLAILGTAIGVLGFVLPPGPDPPPGPMPSTSTTNVPPTQVPPQHLVYDFDRETAFNGQEHYVVDTTGKRRGFVKSLFGGDVLQIAHRQGNAVKFPLPCDEKARPECPRAIIEVDGSEILNPRTSDFSYGAQVLLKADEVRGGANVIQKGIGIGAVSPGNMWRIELSPNGTVSCFLVDIRVSQNPLRALLEKPIADGTWHKVRCTKRRTVLTISVDNASSETRLPPGLSIDNSEPIRFGGRDTDTNNEQFSGALDDVYYQIE